MFETLLAGFALFFGVFGFLRGMVRQFFGLLGIAIAFFIAPHLGKGLLTLLKNNFTWSFLDQKFSASILILLFGITIYTFISEIGYKIYRSHLKDARILRSLDRLGGAFLGGIKGVVIVYLISYLFSGV